MVDKNGKTLKSGQTVRNTKPSPSQAYIDTYQVEERHWNDGEELSLVIVGGHLVKLIAPELAEVLEII